MYDPLAAFAGIVAGMIGTDLEQPAYQPPLAFGPEPHDLYCQLHPHADGTWSVSVLVVGVFTADTHAELELDHRPLDHCLAYLENQARCEDHLLYGARAQDPF